MASFSHTFVGDRYSFVDTSRVLLPPTSAVCPAPGTTLLVLDVELLAPPPRAAKHALDHASHAPLPVTPPSWTSEASASSEHVPARVYRVALDAHSATSAVAYNFHGALVLLEPCEIEMELDGRRVMVSAAQPGHALALEPCVAVSYHTGGTPLRAYVIELVSISAST